jgi:hypothetical protein
MLVSIMGQSTDTIADDRARRIIPSHVSGNTKSLVASTAASQTFSGAFVGRDS